MIDPVKILKRSWHILWSYRALWVFGLLLAIAAGGTSGGSNSNYRYNNRSGQNSQATPQSMQQAFKDAQRELHDFFINGVPSEHITGKDITAFFWIVGIFVLVMVLIGIVVAVARYVSETAIIRMVDEYEASGNQMTIRQGFRIGWSRTAWRLFLINLIVNLPAIALLLVLLIAGVIMYFTVVNGTPNFAAFSVVSTIVLAFITIFVVVSLSVILRLLRNFFWRISVLEDADVRESFKRGWALVRENWKNVGLMWLVMIGLGIVWSIAFVLLAVISLPVVFITAVIALLVAAIPFLLLSGIFSIFLTGWLPWAAGGLFVLPLFFTIAFSPWLLLRSWQAVYTSTVWTLTYREIKAVPAITPPAQVEEKIDE